MSKKKSSDLPEKKSNAMHVALGEFVSAIALFKKKSYALEQGMIDDLNLYLLKQGCKIIKIRKEKNKGLFENGQELQKDASSTSDTNTAGSGQDIPT